MADPTKCIDSCLLLVGLSINLLAIIKAKVIIFGMKVYIYQTHTKFIANDNLVV